MYLPKISTLPKQYFKPIINGNNERHFKNHERVICDKISEHNAVIACAPWFTSAPIINTLSRLKYGCNIIVQKETFIKPKNKTSRCFSMYRQYQNLSPLIPKMHNMDGIIFPHTECHKFEYNSNHSNEKLEAVRCVGGYNVDNLISFPRMHFKFFVFGNVVEQKKIIYVHHTDLDIFKNNYKKYNIIDTDNIDNFDASSIINFYNKKTNEIFEQVVKRQRSDYNISKSVYTNCNIIGNDNNYSLVFHSPTMEDCIVPLDYNKEMIIPIDNYGNLNIYINNIVKSFTDAQNNDYIFHCLEYVDSNNLVFEPKAVWHGSANPTYTSNNNYEIGNYEEDEQLAVRYTQIWSTMLFISESVNWNNVHSSPEFVVNNY